MSFSRLRTQRLLGLVDRGAAALEIGLDQADAVTLLIVSDFHLRYPSASLLGRQQLTWPAIGKEPVPPCPGGHDRAPNGFIRKMLRRSRKRVVDSLLLSLAGAGRKAKARR